MIDLIKSILNEKKISDYIIHDTIDESEELFFIKKNIDLTRAKKARTLKLTVYRDFWEDGDKYRGFSVVYIYPGYDRSRMETLVDEAYQAALYARNKYFELPEGVCEDLVVMDSTLSGQSLADNAAAMAKALYEADTAKEAWVNSSEFYAIKNTVHIVTSAGCDVSYVKFSIKGEFVVQSKANGNDVELHRQFEYDGLDTEALKSKCADALLCVYDRALAVKAPKDLSKIPVILCDDAMGEFLGFYLKRANAQMIYPGYSAYQKGVDVCADAEGERLDITMLPDVLYSDEGVVMSERSLLCKGVVENLHGNVMYSSYIGIPQSGTYGRIRCDNGTKSISELTKDTCIMIKDFSDFQVDEMDGYFGGEFRLAYLYKDGVKSIVTGGTVSGNIFEAQKKFSFSTERYKDAGYEGPTAVRIG